jgi:pyridoxal biosynthesis lyase PdxS
MKTWVRDRLGQLTAELANRGGVARPELVADQLSVIMEGVYASAQALTAEGPARHARTVVESVLGVS